MVILILVSREVCNELKEYGCFFYNLTTSHMLFPSVWYHTVPPSMHTPRGGGDDWWLVTAFCVFISEASLNFWCKQPWQAAGRCTQRHLFLSKGQNWCRVCKYACFAVSYEQLLETCKEKKVQHFISTDVFLSWMTLISVDPHLIKSITLSTRRCRHYIKEYGHPVWWKTHTEPFYLGQVLSHIKKNLERHKWLWHLNAVKTDILHFLRLRISIRNVELYSEEWK